MNVCTKKEGKEKQKSKIKGAAKHDSSIDQYNCVSHSDEMFSGPSLPGL